MIESSRSIVHTIPIEYLVSIIVFLVMLLTLRFAEYRFMRFFAFPIAIIIWLSIEIYQFLKYLQLSFLERQVKEGGRYKVLFIFLFIIVSGIAMYLLSYVFLALMTVSPWYYLPSFTLSTLSKYVNLVLVPEVIRYGSDKLNTFVIFRWIYKKVTLFWAKFKKHRLYRKLASYTVILREWAKEYVAKIKNFIKRFSSDANKPTFLRKIAAHITSIIDGLKQRRKK